MILFIGAILVIVMFVNATVVASKGTLSLFPVLTTCLHLICVAYGSMNVLK
jgi:hypothetical protein